MTAWRLGELADRDRVAERLDETRAAAAERFAGAADELLLQGVAADTEAAAFFVPGRLEVLGKHTDYPGGRGLVAATSEGLCVVATRRADGVLRIDDVGRECALAVHGASGAPLDGHWTSVPLAVARRLAADFPPGLPGAHIALSSDLPAGAGLAASSATAVAVYLALERCAGLGSRPEHRAAIDGREALAAYLSAVEETLTPGETPARNADQPGASQDLTAILSCERGQLGQFGYRPSRLERSVPMPEGYLFAVAASGVRATRADRDRHRRRLVRLAERACGVWRESTGRDDRHLGALLEAAPNATPRMRELLRTHGAADLSGDELEARFEHFVAESSEIVPAGTDALASGDLVALGRLVDHSQQLAERLLGNQVPETVFLARAARELGAAAASAFGTGFGGAVWALVPADGAEEWLARWSESYGLHFPDRAADAAFLLTRPGRAAHELRPADGDAG